ncbi:hypothetical protein PVAG01_00785 [Phlyctema vagabunda]|uniref:DUF7587 domain-containing protein n=1 Tax=Phlyctema vagabunda TaxID=108571 RepID=A0ABR4PVB7_9HELO
MDSPIAQDRVPSLSVDDNDTPATLEDSASSPSFIPQKRSADEDLDGTDDSDLEDDSLYQRLLALTFDSVATSIPKDHPQPTAEGQRQVEIKIQVLIKKYKEKDEHVRVLKQAAGDRSPSSQNHRQINARAFSPYRRHRQRNVATGQRNDAAESAPRKKSRSHIPAGTPSLPANLPLPNSEDEDDKSKVFDDLKVDNMDMESRPGFKTLIKEVEALIRAAEVPPHIRTRISACLKQASVKYQKASNTGLYRKTVIKVPNPKTPAELLGLLRPDKDKADSTQPDEEDLHPWRVLKDDLQIPVCAFPKASQAGLLLRAWDHKSECQIHDSLVGFLSGGASIELQTAAGRKSALAKHADWSNKTKTPFISATTSIEDIETIWAPVFQRRLKESGLHPNEKVAIINAHARLANGWPILRASDEMKHYAAPTPRKYGGKTGYRHLNYINEYLLPFRVGPPETVTTWLRRDIQAWCEKHDESVRGWYEKAAVPAFLEHEKARQEGRAYNTGGHCTCCGGLHSTLPTASAAD